MISLQTLKNLAVEVYSVIHPMIGAETSGRDVGLGFGGDITKLIDATAEEKIVQYLKTNNVSCVFVGEERGVERIGKSPPTSYLIADGVDGTTNAVRGIGFVSSSIAVSENNRLDDLTSAVVINLRDGGIYAAEKGRGATYCGNEIRSSQMLDVTNAVIGIDMSRKPENVEKIIPLIKASKSVRSFGSAALEICLVAQGLLDAYVDIRDKLRAFDIAAGTLILKEAGGVFLQPDGSEIRNVPLTKLNRFSVVAACNKGLFDQISSIIYNY